MMGEIRYNRFGVILVIGIFLFGILILLLNSGAISATSAFSYSPQIQYNSPGSYSSFSQSHASDYWPALMNSDTCEATTDFLMFIQPGSCDPLVVRSDLLEEQNVPVFCKVDIVKLNPLIDVSELKSVKFEGQYGKYVAGVSFHPNSEAIYSHRNYLENPLINDIGYVVILLKRIPREADMPDSVRINLTGILRYDSEGVFGSGRSDYYLEEISDNDWKINYLDYSLFKGRAYLKLESIYEDGARVSVYKDQDTRISTFDLKKGDSAQTYYLPGFYCKARINIKLEDIVAGVKKVRLEVDGTERWFVEGERFLDNKCVISNINSEDKSVSISCRGQKTEILKIGEEKDKEVDRENLQNADLDDLANKIFEKAKEEAYDIDGLYGGVMSESGIIWSARALYELGILAESLGQHSIALEIFHRLINNYSDSSYANSAKIDLGNIGAPSLNTAGVSVRLIQIKIPDINDASAELVVKGKDKDEITKAVLVGDTIEIFKLTKLYQDKVVLQYMLDGKTNQIELSYNDKKQVVEGYEILLRKINFRKVAKISVNADMPSTYSEADFLFEVGIEKRAIQLTPEKTKEIIENLDRSIKKWEGVTENLAKLVKTMKGACFATSAILIAKNFFLGGIQGGATARQEVMPMWYRQCEKESGKDKNEFNNCLNHYKSEIEKDIEVHKKAIAKINSELDILQKANTYTSTRTVNRDLVAKEIVNKYFLNGVSYNYKVYDKSSGTEKLQSGQITAEQMKGVSLSDARELWYNNLIISPDSGASQVSKDAANLEIKKISERLVQTQERITGVGSGLLSADSEGAKNWVNFAKVKYYLQGEAKSRAYIVPVPGTFGGKTGFYAVVREGAYDKSGDFREFWVKNIGADLYLDADEDQGTLISDIGRFLSEPYSVLDLNKEDSRKLVVKARDAIKIANLNYGKTKFVIDKEEVFVDMAGATGAEKRCQDFMSPSDCVWLFNACDPVLCPSSRCDLGGTFRVENVIQSGIIGSIALCMPNFKGFGGDVYVPVCVSGVHAGLDSFVGILKSYKGCLQESLDTGRSVGICDEINSIYLCEFFWRQAAPFLESGLMHLIEKAQGQGTKGGGEYLTVQDAWTQASSSVDYMKKEYAVNAYNAFKARSSADIGTSFCKAFVSAKYPNKGFFDNLLEPDSPIQFHAWFDEIKFTDVTVPATSQYKVFYYIWAGRDQGASYQVYLKNPTDTAYVRVQERIVVDTGYLPREGYLSETKDFTAPAGYQELCVRINGNDHCGFKKVSTSFALNYISDLYYQEQLKRNIKTEKECVSGSASAYSILQPNIEEGGQDMITPSLNKRGIVRICSTTNPGTGVDESRWMEVGICDKTEVKCWLDKKSAENVIQDKKIEASAVGDDVSKKVDEIIADEQFAQDIFKKARKLTEKIKEKATDVGVAGNIFSAVEDKKDYNDLEIAEVFSGLEKVRGSWAPDRVKAEAGYLKFRIYYVLGETSALMTKKAKAELKTKTEDFTENIVEEWREEIKEEKITEEKEIPIPESTKKIIPEEITPDLEDLWEDFNNVNLDSATIQSAGDLKYISYSLEVEKEFTPSVFKYSQKYGINYHLVRAVIMQESGWNPNSKEDVGLMQLTAGLASDFTGNGNCRKICSDIGNVPQTKEELKKLPNERNIQIGTCYLACLKDYYGIKDPKFLVAAYNVGPSKFIRGGDCYGKKYDECKNNLPKTTADIHVPNIIAYYYEYSEDFTAKADSIE